MIARKNGRDGVIKEKMRVKKGPLTNAAGSQVLQVEMYRYRVRKYDPEVPKFGAMV